MVLKIDTYREKDTGFSRIREKTRIQAFLTNLIRIRQGLRRTGY